MVERVTEKHTCSQCNGRGMISYPGKDCGNCKGRGYIDTLTGEESVCPACNGEGYKMASSPCKECNGMGFHISVYEVTDYSIACIPCGGTGRITEEIIYSDIYGTRVDQRQVECPVCHGTGIITDRRIKRIK
jgi:DnaJ-class molecular chaperone